MPPGTVVGKYTVTETLVEGPLGPRFLGRDNSGRVVLLGLVPELVRHAGEGSVRAFLEEAKAAARIRDPHVVRLLKVGPHGGGLYFATEFSEGCTAAELAAGSPLPVATAARIIRDVVFGLAAIHRFGLVHRDIRPENILVAEDGTARLAGLGLVRAVETLQEYRLGIPLAGPLYAAPEFYRDGRADTRSDLYSLGAAYFHLLTGRLPFVADTSLQVLHKHSTEPVPDPRTLRPEVPAECAALVARLMEKGPSRRPQSAAAVIADLDGLLSGMPEPPPLRLPRPTPPPSAEIRPAAIRRTRRSAARWLAAGLGMALFAITAITVVLVNRPPPAPATPVAQHEVEAPAAESKPAGADPSEMPAPNAAPDTPPESDSLAAEFEALSREAYSAPDPAARTESLEKLNVFARRHATGRDPRERDFAANALATVGQLARVSDPPKSEPKSEPAPAAEPAVAGVELQPRWSVRAGVQHSLGLLVSPDGRAVLTRGTDMARIDVWDGASGKPVTALRAESGGQFNFQHCFADGGNALLVACQRVVQEAGQARLVRRATSWSLADGRKLADQPAHAGGLRIIGTSPDGTVPATLGGDADQIGEVKLWDSGLTTPRATVQGHVNGAHLFRFSPDGKTLVTIGRPRNTAFNEVRAWDAADGKDRGILLRQVAHVYSAEFSGDGRLLVLVAADGNVYVLDPAEPGGRRSFALGNGGFYQARFHAGRALLAVPAVRTDKAVRFEPEIWDVAAGRKVATLTPGGPNLQGMVFSPDGRRLAAMMPEQKPAAGTPTALRYQVRVWDIDTGRSWSGETPSKVHIPGDALAFSPDGRAVVLRGGDGLLRVWNAADGRPVVALRAHASMIVAGAFSPDGATFYTAGQDGLVKAWDFPVLQAYKAAPAASAPPTSGPVLVPVAPPPAAPDRVP